jgi:hypothetical protein
MYHCCQTIGRLGCSVSREIPKRPIVRNYMLCDPTTPLTVAPAPRITHRNPSTIFVPTSTRTTYHLACTFDSIHRPSPYLKMAPWRQLQFFNGWSSIGRTASSHTTARDNTSESGNTTTTNSYNTTTDNNRNYSRANHNEFSQSTFHGTVIFGTPVCSALRWGG